MDARHDLGKFITELTVAQRGGVLSSGRDARSDLLIAQRGVMMSTRSVPSHRWIGEPKQSMNRQCGLAHSRDGDRELDTDG
jgi:hypothetical protein